MIPTAAGSEADSSGETTCNLCAERFPRSQHLRWLKDGFEIVQCPNCSLVYRAVLPTDEELASIYGAGYFSRGSGGTGGQGYVDYLGDEELHRITARRRLATLAEAVRPGRLLDVGAAAGFFVDEANRTGWTALGVDVADAMVDWGRRRLGVKLLVGDIDSVEVASQSLDAVTMWDYLEHSRDPTRDVRASFRLLRTGGVLALSTGDVQTVVARVSGPRWHLLTPRHHNFFFSAETLRLLLERNGFDVESIGHPGAVYSLSYVAHKLRTLVDAPPTRVLAHAVERSRLGRVTVPLNLHDIVTVVARRGDETQATRNR